MSFGERLAALRDGKSLTQNELAKLTKISRSRLSLYETNKREPDLQTIKQLAIFFNVTIDYLLGNSSISTIQIPPIKIEPAPPQLSQEDLELLKLVRELKSLPDIDRKEVESYIQFKKNSNKPNELAATAEK